MLPYYCKWVELGSNIMKATWSLIEKRKFRQTHKNTLQGGFEPPTLWLTAIRSNQLSY